MTYRDKLFLPSEHNFKIITHCLLWNFPSAATVLNSVQPHLQTNTVFQPQAASVQQVQAAVQQVTSQPAQVTNAQVTAAQVAAAQATSPTTTVSQSNISVAALQAAGLSINPAIVRMPLQHFTFLPLCCFHIWLVSHVFFVSVVFYSDQCCIFGSTTPVPQFPDFYSHHHQCYVQHGWHYQPDHHKCTGTGGCHKIQLVIPLSPRTISKFSCCVLVFWESRLTSPSKSATSSQWNRRQYL